MKTYKLIKEYPDCNIFVGETITFKEGETEVSKDCGRFIYVYILEECERFSEFWEEVKEKEKLFTTEDGVDIFNEDIELYCVSSNFILQSQYLGTTYNDKNIPTRMSKETLNYKKDFSNNERFSYKFFKSKEKALEYIKWNKPQYSLKEIHEMISSYSYKGCLILQNIKK